MLQTASMSARIVGGYAVFVHSNRAPTDPEWEQALELHRQGGGAVVLPTLVYTDGGAPNATQRVRLNSLVTTSKPRVAVMTPSVLARAAGAALALINSNTRVFGPDQVDRALDHVGARGTTRDLLRRTLEELRIDLKGREQGT
jgi:hypothetical protein